MSTITPAANFPVNAPFNTNPAYSGTFIPAVWSGKLNAKFYAVSTFAAVCNTDWQGEIKGMGDKVIIRTAPDIVSSKYTVGTNLTYGVPTPNTQELNIDQGRYFAFQVNDVLAYQSKPNLIDEFSTDAMENMRVGLDSTCWNQTFTGAAAANKGTAAGVRSGAYNLGSDAAPVALTKDNILQSILSMEAVLDEQDVPTSDRWLIIDPYTRLLLMQSNLAQAQMMGDSKSPVRNGLIGQISHFTTYVSNLLPRIVADAATEWTSGDGSEQTVATVGATSKKSRVIIAGHKSALTFASQFTKTETVRNQNDFGDYVRSLNVFGLKVVQPKSLALLIGA